MLTLLSQKHGVDATIETVETGRQLLFYMDTKFAKADLIYLDYNMPQFTGMETAMGLRKHNMAADIVFYTVDESHATKGYAVDALHYLVEPKIDDLKFEEVFLKAVHRVKKRTEVVISLSCAGERRNIPVEDILYFEVQNRIVTVHYGEKDSFEFYSTLSKLEELLLGKDFLRIHQSYLVSEKRITNKTKQTVEMPNGAVLPVGRSYQGKM